MYNIPEYYVIFMRQYLYNKYKLDVSLKIEMTILNALNFECAGKGTLK